MQKFLCWSWIWLLVIGCGSATYESAKAPATQAENAGEGGENVPALNDMAKADPDDNDQNEKVERKIIYEGRVSLVVEEFEEVETAIPDLVKEFEGYLKEANVNRNQGRWRSGRWVARIPSARFGEFLDEVAKLGIPETRGQTAQDVTMEYLDLEARIKTKKELEQRILQLLEDREGKLSDVVEAEKELSRVRSEIESMEGQLRYLQNRTAFSTVTIDVREEQDYIPEAAPDFSGRIGKAWQESLRALKIAGQNLVIAAVAIAPWIIPLALGAGVMVFGARWIRRKLFPAKPK
jgi:hypothetical protein